MDAYILIITLLSIVIVILGVSWFKWHAFISLTIASLFLAIFTGMSWDKIVKAYETGVGGVLGHLVGILALWEKCCRNQEPDCKSPIIL